MGTWNCFNSANDPWPWRLDELRCTQLTNTQHNRKITEKCDCTTERNHIHLTLRTCEYIVHWCYQHVLHRQRINKWNNTMNFTEIISSLPWSWRETDTWSRLNMIEQHYLWVTCSLHLLTPDTCSANALILYLTNATTIAYEIIDKLAQHLFQKVWKQTWTRISTMCKHVALAYKNNDINTRVILKHVLNKNSIYLIPTNHYTRRDFTFID